MSHSDILYKYRTIDNLEFFLDILLNNRLYAANFEEMNDPMEGIYVYRDDGSINEEMRSIIYNKKRKLNICSLSKNRNSLLMWSHYAGGCRGIVIGLKVKGKPSYIIKEVEYVDDFSIVERYTSDVVENILSKKLSAWKYEKEVRVLTEKDKYINVEIEEIIIGAKMNKSKSKMIKQLISKISPCVKIREQGGIFKSRGEIITLD